MFYLFDGQKIIKETMGLLLLNKKKNKNKR